VAPLARWLHIEFLVDMTISAIEFDVEIAETNAGHRVLESAGVPVHVTRGAF